MEQKKVVKFWTEVMDDWTPGAHGFVDDPTFESLLRLDRRFKRSSERGHWYRKTAAELKVEKMQELNYKWHLLNTLPDKLMLYYPVDFYSMSELVIG